MMELLLLVGMEIYITLTLFAMKCLYVKDSFELGKSM